MRIAVVHNALSVDSSPDDRDVLVQAEAVQEALVHLDHSIEQVACDLNLQAIRQHLLDSPPDLVFNLVESLAGTGRLIAHFPALLDYLSLPYTGCSTEALFLTSNKLLAKASMQAAGMPTPPWISTQSLSAQGNLLNQASHWIIKSVWEHASIGLDQEAILVGPTHQALVDCLAQRAALLGGDCFAEIFINGREFNLSLLDGPAGVILLPPAEIVFDGYGEDKVRIVDYRAKWDENAFEFHHTPRNFDFTRQDHALLDQLKKLALACWEHFKLHGYARVDFRVDAYHQPWILEVNANPCLSPDAGFAAALQQAGISFEDAVGRIVDAAAMHFKG